MTRGNKGAAWWGGRGAAVTVDHSRGGHTQPGTACTCAVYPCAYVAAGLGATMGHVEWDT